MSEFQDIAEDLEKILLEREKNDEYLTTNDRKKYEDLERPRNYNDEPEKYKDRKNFKFKWKWKFKGL